MERWDSFFFEKKNKRNCVVFLFLFEINENKKNDNRVMIRFTTTVKSTTIHRVALTTLIWNCIRVKEKENKKSVVEEEEEEKNTTSRCFFFLPFSLLLLHHHLFPWSPYQPLFYYYATPTTSSPHNQYQLNFNNISFK